MADVQQLWDGCAGVIQSQVSDATWRTWFAGIVPVGIVNGTLVLSVPNVLVRDRLESRFAGLLHDAILDTSGLEIPFVLTSATTEALRRTLMTSPHPTAATHPHSSSLRQCAEDSLPSWSLHLRRLCYRTIKSLLTRCGAFGCGSSSACVQPAVHHR